VREKQPKLVLVNLDFRRRGALRAMIDDLCLRIHKTLSSRDWDIMPADPPEPVSAKTRRAAE
jgi:hypothetical protein